jgi:hypothetical protein
MPRQDAALDALRDVSPPVRIGPIVASAETKVWVALEFEAPDDEVREVEAILRAAGIEADVDGRLSRFHVGPLPWVLIIQMPLTAFITAYAGAAGGDAWRGTKRLVGELCAARRRPGRPDGQIKLESRDHTVWLDDALPDEAFRQLADAELEPGWYVWEEAEERWRRAGP